MSENLTNFLVAMGKSPSMMISYVTDPEKTMADHGLDADDKAAVRSGDETKILARMSAGHRGVIFKGVAHISFP